MIRGACKVCSSSVFMGINKALDEGESPKQVAKMFGFGEVAVKRHASHRADPPPLTSCSVCNHPREVDIRAAISAGRGVNATAKLYNIARTTLKRHLSSCRGTRIVEKGSTYCSVCVHPNVDEINEAVRGGASVYSISKNLGGKPSYETLARHKNKCLSGNDARSEGTQPSSKQVARVETRGSVSLSRQQSERLERVASAAGFSSGEAIVSHWIDCAWNALDTVVEPIKYAPFLNDGEEGASRHPF